MISVTALQQNSKTIYVGLLSTLTVFLLMEDRKSTRLNSSH